MLFPTAHPFTRLAAAILVIVQLVAACAPARVVCVDVAPLGGCAGHATTIDPGAAGGCLDEGSSPVVSSDGCCFHEPGEAVSALEGPPMCDCHVHLPAPSEPVAPSDRSSCPQSPAPSDAPALAIVPSSAPAVALALCATGETSWSHEPPRAMTRALKATRLRI